MINSFIQIVLVYTSTIEFLKTQLYGLYFISFVLLFYFFLFIIAYMVDEGLKKGKHLAGRQYGRFYKRYGDSDYRENINADLVVLGNSRASTSIDPAVLDNILNIRTYNLGLNGGSPEVQHLVFDFYMNVNTKYPQIVLVNIDWLSIGKAYTLLSRKSELLPWCNDKYWKIFFEKYPVFSWGEKYVPLWKYWRKRWLVHRGLKEYWGVSHTGFGKGILGYRDGYICLDDRLPMLEYPFISEIDDDFSSIDSFLQEYIRKDIKVILFYPPIYKGFRESNNTSFIAFSLIKEFAGKRNIPYWDYTQRPECSDPAYFRDYVHLNKKGSAWFSRILAYDLKDFINNKF